MSAAALEIADQQAFSEAMQLLVRGERLQRSEYTNLHYVHGLGGLSDDAIRRLVFASVIRPASMGGFELSNLSGSRLSDGGTSREGAG